MAGNSDAYVDSSAFIAAVDRSDSYHSLFARLFSQPPPLVTSALVVAECHAWFLRRYDRNRAIQFLVFIDELDRLEIVAADSLELREIGRIIRRYRDQDLTLTDAHGLVIMGQRRITNCWSTDWHLGLAGAILVI